MHHVNLKNSLLIVLLWACCLTATAQKKIRIACVGNSITYGLGIANRAKNSYPAQLQHMLGEGYAVENFGSSGATLLKNGTSPYWKRKEYKAALESNPDMVFIMLGTNDSKVANRPFYQEFESDYKELIRSFQDLPTKPRVVILSTVPGFSADSNFIYDPIITSRIIPMIDKVAFETGLEIIDCYHLFAGRVDMFPDKIHPDAIGATIIAKRLYEVVQSKPAKLEIFTKIKEAKKISSFYGFRCADFTLNGRECKVVAPKVSAAGNPWVWRARFWGHQPQADISLLERGFHIAYCDVAELFGNKAAIDAWDQFYALMQQCGLSKKVALEGMSRGGVYVYNWALANPGKVACIYADAPVLDLKSWPGGKGKSAGNKETWEIFKKDYALNEEQAANFKGSPLDNAEKIAKLGFPMLHVVGDADVVVPIAENTTPFEERVKAAGGNITVIHKPGVDHHPHSLEIPAPITDFILRAAGHKVNFAAIAAPGSEFRSGAGWTEGKDWWAQHDDIDSLLEAEKNLDIVFLGNSITQGIGGHRTYVTYKPGLDIFNATFSNYKWECAGISGDRTQNVLWRLQNGHYAQAKPKLIVITIGVNNFADDTAEEIAEGIFAIADYVKKNLFSTKIILTGPLPTGLEPNTDRRKKYDKIHLLLAKHKGGHYVYLPLTGTFVQPDGSLSKEDYSTDGIHLLAGGYKKWALALQPVINKLLK
ncbi:GDSL-type esterase/lipase family protein [Chitinophaga sp.]|uniref:GDSL-type esterase/lipase family protein n=1 Tax=Chitinophaga sp. TaxID=1869181 RepID=UPI002F931CA4